MTTIAPESPAWLADLYRPEDLEAWHLFARHFELTEGFSFVVFLVPDDWAVQYLRSQLPQLLGSDDAVRRVRFDPTAREGALAEAVLSLPPLPTTVRCVWIDADPASPEMFAARDKAWSAAFAIEPLSEHAAIPVLMYVGPGHAYLPGADPPLRCSRPVQHSFGGPPR
jgi:hypothetical protein